MVKFFADIQQIVANVREIIRWQDLLDILLVWFIVYRVLLLIRGTRAVQMLTGFGIILIFFFLSERFLNAVELGQELAHLLS